MKAIRNLFLLCWAALFSITTHATAADEIANSKLQQAILTTQLLAAKICGDKANLDPEVLGRRSSAVMFVMSLQAIGTPDIMAKNPGLLAERMGQMKCGQGGILQIEPQAS